MTNENENEECWGYSAVEHPDQWSGALASREEALKEALVELDAQVFWIQCGFRPRPGRFFPNAGELCEIANERAVDEVGDCAEDFPDVRVSAGDELDAFLEGWVDRHVKRCSFWIGEGQPERIEREA